jgi:hypothetical protein
MEEGNDALSQKEKHVYVVRYGPLLITMIMGLLLIYTA